LIRYIKLNINASDSVKNQNIILLLGDTGTGKSTTIHFLAGSEMRVVNRDGLINIEPLKVIN
jgi:flagellar biosynthesis GTPase FlhF